MRKANINDVKMEIWLRERGDRELRWVTKDGREIPIRDMSIDHLKNIIRGIEGETSKIYWESIKELTPKEINFQNRDQKPKNDLLNAMLNYGYSILASEITRIIVQEKLDPYCGLLHSDLKGRTSLTYDFIEEFRQQITDKSVLSLINNKQIKIDQPPLCKKCIEE